MTNAQILEITRNPESHYKGFDEENMASFRNIWEARLQEAAEYPKREDLRTRAAGVLSFLKMREPAHLRLYLYVNGKERISFLFDSKTEEHFQIT